MIPKQIPYFISQEHNLIVKSIVKMSKNHPVNLLITGKRGLGKTELARQIAAVNGRDYFQVPVAVLQEAGQLLGSEEFRNNETKYFASQFVSAIQTENMVIHLEELNRAESPKALGELFALLDDTRYLRHEKLGEIKVANGVIFIGTLNMGYEYTGIDPLDAALRDRFVEIELGYLPESVEETLIMSRSGLSGPEIKQLVKFASGLRFNTKEPIDISTRKVIQVAELVASGLSIPLAIKTGFAMDRDKMETVLLSLDISGQLKVGDMADMTTKFEMLSESK